jgi:hypothetical protein
LAFFPKKNPTPTKNHAMAFTFLPAYTNDWCSRDLAYESKLLEEVRLTANYDDNAYVTWSVNHAAQRKGLDFSINVLSILPRSYFKSVAMVRHVMGKVRDRLIP